MRQRLGLAGTLLGDPHTVVLDEPGNGLDPEGIKWIRDVLIHLAGEGRTVLVSSHLLSEMQLMAQDLVVIGQGALIEQCTVGEFVQRHADRWVRVKSPNLTTLLDLLQRTGVRVTSVDDSGAQLRGVTPEVVGELAAEHRVVLHELSVQTGSLEDAFLRATAAAVEYHASAPPSGRSAAPPMPPPPPPQPDVASAPTAGVEPRVDGPPLRPPTPPGSPPPPSEGPTRGDGA